MARTKGSQELFDLIHSLTPEEKGYYKKFSKRHVPNGSNYLKLFDAIDKQQIFEEASLKKKFNNYSVMKVYLKDFITDSLLLYCKNKHPHVNLFSQIQKVHILLVKGQYAEAVRVLKKTLLQCKKMELFSVERYLLRVLAEINHQRLANPVVIKEFHKQYAKDAEQNWQNENNLTEWELLSTEWFAKARGLDPFDKPIANVDFKSIQAMAAYSTRSEIKKLNCLCYLYHLQHDTKGKYETGRKQFELSEKFKAEIDPLFNNIYIRNNHITSCLDLNRFADAIKLADNMVNAETQAGFYYHLAFPKSVLFKLDAYFHLAKFKEAGELLKEVDGEMLKVCSQLGDYTGLKEYYFFKHIFLFVNRSYRECWMDMQSIKLKHLAANYLFEFADYSMLQLMVQFDMGNYSTVRNQAAKTETAFRKLKITDATYLLLIDLFKQVQPSNAKSLAFKTSGLIKKYCKKNKLAQRKAFGLLDYTIWLTAVTDGIPVKDVLSKELLFLKPQ